MKIVTDSQKNNAWNMYVILDVNLFTTTYLETSIQVESFITRIQNTTTFEAFRLTNVRP